MLTGRWHGIASAVVGLVLAVAVAGGRPVPAPPAPPADPSSYLPAVVPAGWRVTGEPLEFGQDTLWDFINGQAVHYLAYGFQSLVVAEYERGDGAGAVSVEIYAMASRDHAFGIFASERVGGEQPREVGAGGYLSDGALNFWQGRCYVKLVAFDLEAGGDAVLAAFATAVAGRISDPGGTPGLLGLLPTAHRVPDSERFVPTDVLGLSALRNGSLARFEREGDHYQVLLADLGSPEEARQAFASWEAFLSREGYRVARQEAPGREQITATREEVATIFQRGRLVGGVLDADSPERASAALEELLAAAFPAPGRAR